MKHRIYIAGPFFNPAQIAIIQEIEDLCMELDVEYYSPRLHSGSHLMTVSDRKQFDKWTPVLESNIENIESCDLMVAVLEYAMPSGHKLCICATSPQSTWGVEPVPEQYIPIKKSIELPDNGTVWEMGYASAIGTPVIGYHSKKELAEMNLMISHTVEGVITGSELLKAAITEFAAQGTLGVSNGLRKYCGRIE